MSHIHSHLNTTWTIYHNRWCPVARALSCTIIYHVCFRFIGWKKKKQLFVVVFHRGLTRVHFLLSLLLLVCLIFKTNRFVLTTADNKLISRLNFWLPPFLTLHFLLLFHTYLISAVCNQTCLNGGLCTSPGYCSCRNGYIGEACEQDLDECAAGLHTCKSYSYCVNMPGWYYCKCKPGYETNGYDCHDINECARNTHSCHPTATCINSDGHFGCFCADDDPECRLSK